MSFLLKIKEYTSETIVKLILLQVIIVFTISIVSNYSKYHTEENYYKPAKRNIVNQNNKQELSNIIKKELLEININFKTMLFNENIKHISNLSRKIDKSINIAQLILPILKSGGTFTNIQLINLYDKNEFREKINYFKPVNEETSIDVINISPKLVRLKQLLDKSKLLSIEKISNKNMGESEQNELILNIKQTDALLLRLKENINNIYYRIKETNLKSAKQIAKTQKTVQNIVLTISVLENIIILLFSIFIAVKIFLVLKKDKEIEKNIEETNNSLKTIIENIPVGVVLVNSKKEIIQINKQASEILKYDNQKSAEQKLIGQKCDNSFCNVDSSKCPIIDLGKTKISFAEHELYLNAEQSKKTPVLKSTIPLKLNNEFVLMEVFIDISERIKNENEKNELEKQTLHTQKLESLGVLAGGIAHDFNNLLTAILGNADLAKKKLSPVSPSMKNINRVIDTAHRAAELSNQMLAYSGKGRFVLEDINLTEIVEEMTHLLEVSISKKAVIRYEYADNIPPIEGDVTQLRQIIMNLITNASEAIGDRSGYISINTGVMDCDDNYIKQCRISKNVKAGRYSYIEIADSGLGMNKTTIDKLFDPFFTTKFTGRGLGMSAVLGIIRGHNGTIKVYSEEKKGTTIKVFFPALDRPLDEIYQIRNKIKSNIENIRGTVLIADDEESVLSVASEMVETFGLTVLKAKDGREALEVYKNNNKTIDLIILDLTMPHLDGEQAFRELRLINPDIPIIMSSGYNEQTVTQKFSGKRMTGFIQKPYRLDLLFNEIKKVLVKEQG